LDASAVIIQVRILGFELAIMLDDDQLAEGAIPCCPGHDAIRCRSYWCATRSRIVGAAMCSDRVQDWMFALQIEIGADAEYVERSAEEGFAHAFPLGVEIAHLTFFINVAHRRILFALIDELGGDDVTVAYILTIQIFLFIEDAERVARARVQNEI